MAHDAVTVTVSELLFRAAGVTDIVTRAISGGGPLSQEAPATIDVLRWKK